MQTQAGRDVAPRAAFDRACHRHWLQRPALTEPNYPPDFALVVTVLPGRYASDSDPARAPAQYVVESDRSLRVALGPGVYHGLYPPTTAVLTAQDMAALHRIVADHGLASAKSSHRQRGAAHLPGGDHRQQPNLPLPHHPRRLARHRRPRPPTRQLLPRRQLTVSHG